MNLDARLIKIGAQIKLKRRAWRLAPPIPLADVEAIEIHYGFSLPEEYKHFITQIGNGGNLPSLHDHDACRAPAFEDKPELERVSRDFPLTESWEWDTDLNFSVDCPEDQEKWDRVQNDGIIVLAQEDVGGGQTYFLIVSGPRHGEVWERDEGGTLRLPGCTFLDWLEMYLSKRLDPYTDQLFRQEKAKREECDPLSTIKALMGAKRWKDIRWNPPVSLDTVQNFEQRHGVTLPEEYVTFITQIANGCENFPSANSHGKGGIFFSLEQLDCLPNLDKPFYFTEMTEEIRSSLKNPFGPNAYTANNPIWSALFSEIPQEEPLSPVWACSDYSVLWGVLPFATYNDANPNWKRCDTQPFLIVMGPLRGEVWRAYGIRLMPDGDNFYQWAIKMLKGDAR